MPWIDYIDANTGLIVDRVWEDDPIEVLHIPTSVSRFQARAALMDAGILADAELAIRELGPLEQLAWAEATEWKRDSHTIAAIAESLSLSDSDVDNLFIEASKIVA